MWIYSIYGLTVNNTTEIVLVVREFCALVKDFIFKTKSHIWADDIDCETEVK